MLPNEFFEGLLLFPQRCEVALFFRGAPIYEEINSVGIKEKKEEVTQLCMKLKKFTTNKFKISSSKCLTS